MTKLARYFQKLIEMQAFERWYLFKAAGTLTFIKLGLSALPFHTFRKIYSRMTQSDGEGRLTAEEMDQVARSVDRAANHLPFELLCLPRALAAKYLLRHEPFLTLEIGIELGRVDSFEAHAWVEKKGKIIIGDWNEHITYQRLWSWE